MYRVESLPISIPIGRQGENHAMKIEIDCSSFLAEWPQATITAMLRRSVAENPYILVTSIDSNGILTWEPTAHDTGIEGDGQIEIRAVENDVLAKSVTAIVCVERSLTPPEPDTPIDWVENIKSDIAQSVTSAANSASDAAKSAASAQESAAAAAGSASAAESSAKAAAGSASAAGKSAASAAQSADAASGSASNAAQLATDAAQAAEAAEGSANQSAAARDAAQEAQTAAGKSASDAAGSATAAAGSKDAAAQSATEAAASAAAAEKAAQDAAGIIDDAVIAEGKAWSSKQIANQNYAHFTVSGNPAVCEDVLEGYPLELSASWEPKQEGSGTPSPDNVRPITGGRNSITFTRAEDTRQITCKFERKIFGAWCHAKKAQKTWANVLVDKAEEWMPYGEPISFWYKTDVPMPLAGTEPLCSHFAKASITTNGLARIYTSLPNFKEYVAAQYAAGTPVQICYALATPQEIAVEGADDLPALAGTNTISTDADTLTVGGVKPLRKPIDDTRVETDNAWSAKHTADTLLPMQTVTGNPVAIETLEGYPLELNASWEPIQEGEGEPSPDNVRLIKGRDNVKITRKNKTQEDSITLTLPTTIYGGEVDVETGMGYKKWEAVELNGTERWQVRQVIDTYSYVVSLKSRSTQGICSHYKKLTYADVGSSTVAGTIGCYMEYSLSAIFNVPFASIDDWKSYLAAQYAAGTPVQIAYKSDAPESFTATGGGRIYALAGTNTILTDADTVTITAPTPPQTTASAAEAQAAKLDYVAMMADVDVDDLTAVDDAGADSGMDMPTDIEGSETDGKQKV